MRLIRPSSLLSILLFSSAFAEVLQDATPADAPSIQPSIQQALPEKPASATNSEDVAVKNTVFNGVEVPPMKELNGTTYDEDIKDGYWYVPTPLNDALHHKTKC